ncbi:hypothetical protein HDU88_007830 [Geranomyces variabilis]|nr:hypothetical protein HDU88_007830 [Geranomyces variabilis]
MELRRPVVPPDPRGSYNVLWSRIATAVPASVLAALRQTRDINQLPTATATHLFEGAIEVEVNQAVILNCPFFNPPALRTVLNSWARMAGATVVVYTQL